MDFVFDRSAETRVIKSLTIVDDATHESVAIVPERAIGGLAVTHILDRLAMTRPATHHSNRQHQGILRPGDVDLGASTGR